LTLTGTTWYGESHLLPKKNWPPRMIRWVIKSSKDTHALGGKTFQQNSITPINITLLNKIIRLLILLKSYRETLYGIKNQW